MSRHSRIASESGIYHIIIRGIGKQILFEDDTDRLYFLKALKKYKDEESIRIFAYCLMENHVHLLIKCEDNSPGLFMKKLEGSYVFYYNHKYERTGTLFQDRFKSEAVEDEKYLATVLRYILRNPEKAGICRTSEYKWSSYAEYAGVSDISDTNPPLDFFEDRKALLDFINRQNDDICPDLTPPPPGESRAKQIIREQLHSESGTVLQSFGKKERDAALRKLKDSGLSVRQIERLCGINRGIIQRA